MRKREKFVELAEKRVAKTLKDLQLIGNLSNKRNYSFTNDDARKIVTALENAVKDVKRKFEDTFIEDRTEFKL